MEDPKSNESVDWGTSKTVQGKPMTRQEVFKEFCQMLKEQKETKDNADRT
jgi:hypothetical protein